MIISKFSVRSHDLQFRFEAGTSRGVLTEKRTYFIELETELGLKGVGEAGPLRLLSIDDREDLQFVTESLLKDLFPCEIPENELGILNWVNENIPEDLPSVKFGMETALLDLFHGSKKIIFDTPFSRGEQSILINGLIWMGDQQFMLNQIAQKLEQGFSCVKMKIGAIDFDTECKLLEGILSKFSKEEMILRVDANGAFTEKDVFQKLKRLSDFDLHSIEQPVKQGQLDLMKQVCAQSPFPIALDEELIGVHTKSQKEELLTYIQPQYIILKPTLLGGIRSCNEWIELAENLGIGWWITSALESNIGLNAVSQYTASLNNDLPQGLGTGQLYQNNIYSALELIGDRLGYNPKTVW